MNNYKKYNDGFTLIEMMVTVAIVGIFASIALPSFSNLIERNRISTATNELLTNLMLSKSEALKRSNTVTLCSSTDQETCNGGNDYSDGWIIFLDCLPTGVRATGAVAGCGPTNEEVLIKANTGFDSLFTTNNVGNAVTFNFTGRPAGLSTFSIGTERAPTVNRSQVSINLVGRVRAQ